MGRMKLPKFSLRELFLVVALLATALGWLINWSRYHIAYIVKVNEATRARAREEQLRTAFEHAGYGAKWDDSTGYTVAKIDDLPREERGYWVLGGFGPKPK